MGFALLVGAAAMAGGATAAVAAFGIGSLLTPVVAFRHGIRLAVVVVAIPHLAGTAFRLWLLRGSVDRKILSSFGVLSAGGALAGAFLLTLATSRILTLAFGALLTFAGVMGVTSASERFRLSGPAAWAAGVLSGLLGGLLGNQGGIRAAAMLGFDVSKSAFVATATASALLVDLVRVPVYLAVEGPAMVSLWPIVLIGVAGVLIGTVAGGKVLALIPEPVFKRVVSAIVLALGLYILLAG